MKISYKDKRSMIKNLLLQYFLTHEIEFSNISIEEVKDNFTNGDQFFIICEDVNFLGSIDYSQFIKNLRAGEIGIKVIDLYQWFKEDIKKLYIKFGVRIWNRL